VVVSTPALAHGASVRRKWLSSVLCVSKPAAYSTTRYINKLIDEIIFLLFAHSNSSHFIIRMWGNSSSARTGAAAFYIDHVRAQSIPYTHAVSTVPLYANPTIVIIIQQRHIRTSINPPN